MEETSPPGTKVMHLRVPAPLHAQIVEYAARSHRSQNGAAVALMESALQSLVSNAPDLHTREDTK
jgi:predicted HicB family RNase H-like nuclease